MSTLSTHVLDTALGRPAAAVPVALEHLVSGDGWQLVGSGKTDANGRLGDFAGELAPGTYRITFDTQAYYAARAQDGLYPSVTVLFQIRAAKEHYHVPLLLSPNGYTTYRGS